MTTLAATPNSPSTWTPIHVDHLYRAQFGEDRILWQVFKRRHHGYFIEVGAFDGITLSNTYFLEQMGWTGILVEPIPELCEHASYVRPRSLVINTACSKPGSPPKANFTVTKNVPVLSFLNADQQHKDRCISEGAELVEIEVSVTTLDDILMETRRSSSPHARAWVDNKGWQIDLVSIDVEGGELDVLAGFDLERFKPRVLVMENDRSLGSGIEPYLSDRNYRKFHRQKINDFYVRDESGNDDLMLSGFVTDNA